MHQIQLAATGWTWTVSYCNNYQFIACSLGSKM